MLKSSSAAVGGGAAVAASAWSCAPGDAGRGDVHVRMLSITCVTGLGQLTEREFLFRNLNPS